MFAYREALLAEMGVAVREDGGTVGVFSPKKVGEESGEEVWVALWMLLEEGWKQPGRNPSPYGFLRGPWLAPLSPLTVATTSPWGHPCLHPQPTRESLLNACSQGPQGPQGNDNAPVLRGVAKSCFDSRSL